MSDSSEMFDYRFWLNFVMLIVTVVAIVIGPLLAVRLQRKADEAREKRTRRYMILNILMRTRSEKLSSEHVGALNLIQLEFYGSIAVIDAYKTYSDFLNSHFPSDQNALERHTTKGASLFLDLLFEIARDLKFNFDKSDLQRLSYLPMSLFNFNDNLWANMHLFREVLEGKRPLVITDFVPKHDSIPPTE